MSLYSRQIAKTSLFFMVHLRAQLLHVQAIRLELSQSGLEFRDARFTLHACIDDQRQLMLQFLNALIGSVYALHKLRLFIVEQGITRSRRFLASTHTLAPLPFLL